MDFRINYDSLYIQTFAAMLSFPVGLIGGVILGAYIAQNYQVGDISSGADTRFHL